MRISDWSSDVCSSDLFTGWGRGDRAKGNGAPQCYPRRTGFNRELLAPPPAKAGGGWEGVPTVRADPEDTPPQPSPAFAGEGAKSSRLKPLLQGFAGSHRVNSRLSIRRVPPSRAATRGDPKRM